VTPALVLERGDPANVSHLALGSHTGTHLDAPRHFIPGGATVDHLPLDTLVGPARVVECPAGPIRPDSLAPALGRDGPAGRREARVLVKTGNSRLWTHGRFARDYQALTLEAARELVRAGVLLVGVDYLSVEAFGGDGGAFPVHRCLLAAGVVILEGLDLSAVGPGRYELLCLPLRLKAGDGAPARAVLRPL
jgi:arylformamidase